MPGGEVTRMLVELATETGVPVRSSVKLVDPSDGPNKDLSAGLEMGAGDGDVGPACDRA